MGASPAPEDVVITTLVPTRPFCSRDGVVVFCPNPGSELSTLFTYFRCAVGTAVVVVADLLSGWVRRRVDTATVLTTAPAPFQGPPY